MQMCLFDTSRVAIGIKMPRKWTPSCTVFTVFNSEMIIFWIFISSPFTNVQNL